MLVRLVWYVALRQSEDNMACSIMELPSREPSLPFAEEGERRAAIFSPPTSVLIPTR